MSQSSPTIEYRKVDSFQSSVYYIKHKTCCEKLETYHERRRLFVNLSICAKDCRISPRVGIILRRVWKLFEIWHRHAGVGLRTRIVTGHRHGYSILRADMGAVWIEVDINNVVLRFLVAVHIRPLIRFAVDLSHGDKVLREKEETVYHKADL